jgi:hypothetical protein
LIADLGIFSSSSFDLKTLQLSENHFVAEVQSTMDGPFAIEERGIYRIYIHELP